MYGTDAGIESVVEVEFAEVDDDSDVASSCSEVLDVDEGMSHEMILEVERFDRVGRLGLKPFTFEFESSS